MMNGNGALSRRLSDPDFQGTVVARCLGVTMVQALLLGVFAIHDSWVWSHPVAPKYFYVDGRNAPRAAVALDSPIVNDPELLQWTVRWVLAPYNVNYHDFPVQLNNAGQHYTMDGWRSFANSYVKAGNFDKLKQARLLCYAVAQRAPVIRASQVTNGRLSYVIQFPLIQTCQNVNQENTQRLMMTATVQRVDDPDHPDGLAISQLVATLG
ncbi:MAG: DotI/IcmL/TraM family protein [Janthinobacterium lividum]